MAENQPTQPKCVTSQKCSGCGAEFVSRNALFKHLRETDGVCLTGAEYEHFCKQVRGTDKGIRVLILFGYMPVPGRIRNGDDAANLLLQAIQQWQNGVDRRPPSNTSDDMQALKYNRSYGNSQRALDVLAQDEDTGVLTEVLATKLPPIRGNRTVDQWLDEIQEILNSQFASPGPCLLRILGRQDVPSATRFNAEMDVSHRRVEYLLPIDFITWNVPDVVRSKLESLPAFEENHKTNLNHSHVSDAHKTDQETRMYLFQLKKIMQNLTTQVVDLDMQDKGAVMEKSFSLQKRKMSSKKPNKGKKAKKQDDEKPSEEQHHQNDGIVAPHHRLLRRKRFHNFTLTLMAHEYLACRRMDRMYHRATLNFPSIDPQTKPFIVLSITGDIFLTGQVCRVIGLFLALANNLIDHDIIDCVFDESYPHLIPTPPAPICGMVAAEARYMSWEGKLKSILSARSTDRYPTGWNQRSTLERVKDWHDTIHEEMARRWLSKGRDDKDGRLNNEKEWTETVLLPWVEKTKQHLDDYKKWKRERVDQELTSPTDTAQISLAEEITEAAQPLDTSSLEYVDPGVPEAFKEVLHHLRKIDESGQWPSTTLKRQLVMVSTADSDEAKQQAATSLSMAFMKARNNKESRLSAYGFAEGQGGASGSFSVGLMPGGINKQPKSNFLFPKLVRAAFELERVLCPNREPSSTIAINRNAQFRPHTDSGAGAGQSTSLIVGLGTYAGGELMVEGEKHDIRYKAIEFNGWKQRHWTMPFAGERYSLVWFTPKGCEGMRGIDLNLTAVQEDSMPPLLEIVN